MRRKITFPGNPWPAGHQLAEFTFGAHLYEGDALRPPGFYLDFHLVSARYDADGPGNPGDDDWTDPIVWDNFHRCTLSSTEWHFGGVPVGIAASPFDFASTHDLVVTTDALETTDARADFSERAFHIYLLGHDAVAAHSIRLRSGERPSTFSVAWTGRIALAYAGSYDFDHSFEVFVDEVGFDGIDVPTGLVDDDARSLLRRSVVDAERFSLTREGDRRRFTE